MAYDWKKSVEKGIKMAVAAICLYLAGKGFELTPAQQGFLVTLGMGAFASLANALKINYPKWFWWL